MAQEVIDKKLDQEMVKDTLNKLPKIGRRRHLTQTFSSQGSINTSFVKQEKAQNTNNQPAKRRQSFRNVPLAPGHETTLLDSPEWHSNKAFGFWVLFWTVLGVQAIQRVALNVIESGRIIPINILSIMQRGILKVSIAEGGLYLGMWVTYFTQVLVKKNIVNWNSWGWILQHVYQTAYIFFFLTVARVYDFPWIAQIFLVLHNVTFLMKQHSYATYNGHLHSVTSELDSCRRLREKIPSDSPALEEVEERISFCETELLIQSKTIRYPENITAQNFFMYTVFPTVVYQLEYPRTEKIRWGFLFKKLTAVFGVLLILIQVSEDGLFPVAMYALKLRDTAPVRERLAQYPWVLLSSIGPFITCYLLVFYLIWDAVLNCVAELTRFGDREFYRDWWNTVSWDEFARNWNVPVHNFLYRHVYRSSIATMHLSKFGATVLTFLLSALVHELTMWVIFDRVRGYLFAMQISQILLTAIGRLKFMRDRPLWGRVIFWIGICTGPSMLCSLYLIL